MHDFITGINQIINSYVRTTLDSVDVVYMKDSIKHKFHLHHQELKLIVHFVNVLF